MWCADLGLTLVTACLHSVVFGCGRLDAEGFDGCRFWEQALLQPRTFPTIPKSVYNLGKCSRLQFLDLRGEMEQCFFGLHSCVGESEGGVLPFFC